MNVCEHIPVSQDFLIFVLVCLDQSHVLEI